MCVCVCLRVFFVYVCVCLRVFACVCVCMRACVYILMAPCTGVLTICVYGRVSMLASVFLHAFMCVRVHIQIEAYISKIPTLPEFNGLMLFRSRLLT